MSASLDLDNVSEVNRLANGSPNSFRELLEEIEIASGFDHRVGKLLMILAVNRANMRCAHCRKPA